MLKRYHYVPVLRWKRAEEQALFNLRDSERERILPIMRLGGYDIEAYSRNKEVSLEIAFQRIVQLRIKQLELAWGNLPLLVDNTNLEILGSTIDQGEMLSIILDAGRNYGLSMIPVTTLSQHFNFQEHLEANLAIDRRGVAIRIPIERTLNSDFGTALHSYIENLGFEKDQIDLILDYGDMHELEGKPSLATAISVISTINQWRSLVFIGESFPPDLSGSNIELGRNEIERKEWIFWSNNTQSFEIPLRLPTYGDYSIQNTSYQRPPAVPNVSASIRYAADMYWVVMRGEGHNRSNMGNGRYSAQYCANAQLLVESHEFSGPDFSAGDRFIYDKQNDFDHPGNSTQWLTAGLNHHIVSTLHQIANVTGSAFGDGLPVSAAMEVESDKPMTASALTNLTSH